MKILILYRELAAYTVECLNKLASSHELMVVCYPINSEAPFQFELNSTINVILKSEGIREKTKQFQPDFILCSGWGDQDYLNIVSHLKSPTALAFDTNWKNSLKFILGSFYFRLKFKRHFQFAFVPGKSQIKTATILGFNAGKIFNGLYCSEDKFRTNRKDIAECKELWCVARYIPSKNINFLCSNFLSIPPNERSGWKLHIAGTGELFRSRIEDDSIVHHGFVQPSELSKKLQNASAFVLPSLYEPWGVVVHEMASLGKPLLLSNAVGAREDLLKEGENGFSFNPTSDSELKNILLKIFQFNSHELQAMGNKSFDFASKFSSEIWVQQINKMIRASCAE